MKPSPVIAMAQLTNSALFNLVGAVVTACLFTFPGHASDKTEAIRGENPVSGDKLSELFLHPAAGGSGHRTEISNGDVRVPVVVVRGTPYEMGRQLGRLIGDEMHAFIPKAMAGITAELGVKESALRDIWSRTSAYTDDRVEQELVGLADGSGMPLSLLQAMHAVPLLMPYSCSSIAAWGDATEDGHLYQTRDLDWSLEVGAHEFPVIVVYVPDKGIPHVVPTFAGMIGAHTGMNARGIVLSEMGDASRKEMPYRVDAPHFTTIFRNLLYDADSLSSALAIFKAQPLTKRYHFVFGDGQTEHRAVKIKAHSPEPAGQRVMIWKDNDRTDEFAPNVLSCVVYNDEGRGAFPTLKNSYGKLNGEKLVQLANQIPIKGGNVEDVVYDATALRMWVSYAKGDQEAYQRPYVYLDLRKLDADHDGKPDLE
jgi:isopenicillin-N N-acyltransferase-like protein